MGSGPPRLTYPGPKPALDLPELPSHSATEDAETELLPFALDSDAMPASPQPLAPLRARAGSGLPPAGLAPRPKRHAYLGLGRVLLPSLHGLLEDEARGAAGARKACTIKRDAGMSIVALPNVHRSTYRAAKQ